MVAGSLGAKGGPFLCRGAARGRETALAVGSGGTILRSLDGGTTWSPVATGTEAQLRSVALPTEGETALAVGWGGILLRSTDGGATWSPATSVTNSDLFCVALSADGKTALAAGGYRTILRSTDGGTTWSAASDTAESLSSIAVSSIAVSADGKMALAAGGKGTILRSTNGGTTWSPAATGTAEGPLYVALSADGKTALAVGEKGTILRSSDGGTTWSAAASGTTAVLRSVALSADGKTALAVGEQGTILRSTDGGTTWSPAASGTTAELRSAALSTGGKTALALGQGGTVLRSSDGGIAWSAPLLRRAPPRIAWLLWGAGFLALLPAFVALPSINPPSRDIAQLLATDRPLRKGDQDATGQADYLAAQIGSFLRNTQTAPPITIAITGSWGSGKSSVLSRLRDDLVAGGQRPVWFNAWHRQGEESMLAALMQAVRVQAVPSWWSLAGLDVRVRLLLARVRSNPVAWLLVLLLLAGVMGFTAAARWPTPAEAMVPLHGLLKDGKFADAGLKLLLVLGWPLTILVGLLIVIGGLRDRLSSAGLDPGRLLAATGRATRWRDLGVQLAFRDRFQQALSEVTAALDQRTLTILIDDLDRCRPDQIAEVLEAINFLTDADGCFVMFGFARPQVLAGIGLANREIAAELEGGEDTPEIRRAYAEDYLRKLIQMEVPVPRFKAPAAERLVDTASKIGTEFRPVHAWLPALGGLCLLLWVAIGMWGGERLYSAAEEAWNAAATLSTVPTAEPAPVKAAQPSNPPPPGRAASPREPISSYFYPGASAPLPLWTLLVILLALGFAALAAAIEARRPHATSDDDSKDFTDALHHWAVAAYEVRQSPREMKRFLNRLRFAAAGRAPDLPDDILVGLAVLKHAGADAEIAGISESGATRLSAAIDSRANSCPMFAHIREAPDPAALASSGLPPFDPSPAQTETFFALWEGVRVEG